MTNCSIYWWLLNKVHQSSEQQSLYNHIHVYHLIFSAEKILISLQWNRRGLLFVDHKNCTLDYVLHQRDDFKLNFVLSRQIFAVFILVFITLLYFFLVCQRNLDIDALRWDGCDLKEGVKMWRICNKAFHAHICTSVNSSQFRGRYWVEAWVNLCIFGSGHKSLKLGQTFESLDQGTFSWNSAESWTRA